MLLVGLGNSGSTYSRSAATTLLTGIRNPLPATATGSGFLVGDWSTGIVYRIASRRR